MSIQIRISVSDEDARILSARAEECGLTRPQLCGSLVHRALGKPETGKDERKPADQTAVDRRQLDRLRSQLDRIERQQRELSATGASALQASLGVQGLLSWVLPALMLPHRDVNSFVAYMASQRPAAVNRMAQEIGAGLRDGDGDLLTALRDVPRKLGLDTRKIAGVSLKEWESKCGQGEKGGEDDGGR